MTTVGFPKLGGTGRLGNQMFQVASTIGIARTCGLQPVFPPSWAYRNVFNVPDKFFSDEHPDTLATDCVTGMGAYTDYMQDLGLFEHVESEIREAFSPTDFATHELERSNFFALPKPVMSVHVRRGDNAVDPATPDKHLYHPLRPLSYYIDGINLLRGEVTSVACFSDDIPWCREHIPADYYHVGVPRPKEHEPEYQTAPVLDWIDLFLMSFCDRHVISNSTYAWWGAWLSNDPAPVYPAPWYGPKITADASLMFPKSWRKLEHECSSI